MLMIEREPLYKNKFMLSGIAVLAGFVATVGLIRTITPAEQSTAQSAQTNSSRRAASLLPVMASDSESEKESGNTASSNDQSVSQGSTTPQKSRSVASSAQPSASTQANSSTQPTPAADASGDTTAGTSGSGTTGSNEAEESASDGLVCELVDMMGLPIVGQLVDGVCTLI